MALLPSHCLLAGYQLLSGEQLLVHCLFSECIIITVIITVLFSSFYVSVNSFYLSPQVLLCCLFSILSAISFMVLSCPTG